MGFLGTLGKFAASAGGGNVIGAGIAGIASLLGGIGANKSQRETNATNLQIARENNAQQLAIARENNAAQYAAMMDNNKWSRDTAIEMFNLENAYNTPEAQRNRLLAAGLNPAVIMNGSGSQIAASASSPSAAGSTISPSLPSFVTPTLGAPPPVLLGAVDAISKLASAGAQAAAAAKTRKEASWIDESMKNQIDEIKARIQNQEANTAYTNMIKQIEEAHLPNKYKAEITKLSTAAALDILNGRVAEADARLKDAETMLTRSNNKRINAELPLVLSNLKQTFQVLKSQEKANEAAANASNADAAFKGEQTRTQAQETERLKISNRYADDMDAAAFAGNKAQLIKTLRDAYRSGNSVFDSVRDFASHLRKVFGLKPSTNDPATLNEVADWLIESIKADTK